MYLNVPHDCSNMSIASPKTCKKKKCDIIIKNIKSLYTLNLTVKKCKDDELFIFDFDDTLTTIVDEHNFCTTPLNKIPDPNCYIFLKYAADILSQNCKNMMVLTARDEFGVADVKNVLETFGVYNIIVVGSINSSGRLIPKGEIIHEISKLNPKFKTIHFIDDNIHNIDSTESVFLQKCARPMKIILYKMPEAKGIYCQV